MGKRFSTISDYMGKFSTVFRDSSLRQDNMLSTLSSSLDAVLDNFASKDLSTSRLLYRPEKQTDETIDSFLFDLVKRGDIIKCTPGIANSVISALGGKNLTITNADGVSMAVPFTAVNTTVYNDITVLLTSGGAQYIDYPNYYFLYATVFTFRGQYYISNWVFPATDLNSASHLNYLGYILPHSIDALIDATSFFEALAYFKARVIPTGHTAYTYGVHVFNEFCNLGLTSQQESSYSAQTILSMYFGAPGSYTSSDLEAFLIGYIDCQGTCYAMFHQVADDVADSLAINNINTFIASSLSSVQSSIDRISTFISTIKSSSPSVSGYLSYLRGALTTDQDTFASKFAALWNSASAERDSDDNSLMVFKDRSSAAPVKFLSGLVSSAISTGAQIIGAALVLIAGAIGKVVGIVVSAIGSIISVTRQLAQQAVYAGTSDKYNVACLPFDEFQMTNGGLEYLDANFEAQLREYGFLTLNYPFAKIFLYAVNDTNYEVAVCPCPVSYGWMQNIMNFIRDNSIIGKDSHDHFYITGYSKIELLREYLCNHDDVFTILEYQDLDQQEFDHWLRYSTCFGILISRLFVLLLQGSQGEIRPYYLTGSERCGTSSVPINSMLNFLQATWATALDVVVTTTPTWRQLLGQESFSYSAYPSLFLEVDLTEVPYADDFAEDGMFSDHQSSVINCAYGFTDDSYIWTMDEAPRSVYTIPKIDLPSAILGGITLAIITIAVTVTALIVSTKIRRAKQRSAAMHAAKAEAAWQTFTVDTSAENYEAFRKAARSNNLASYWNGGDRISKYSYWSDVAGSSEEGSPDLSKMISKIQKSITG